MQISVISATNFGETLENSRTLTVLKTVLTQLSEHCGEIQVKNRSRHGVKKWFPICMISN